MQVERMYVYFDEAASVKFVPRSVLVDLEPGVLDSIKCRPFGRLFKPENFISSSSSASNNWAKNHYTDSAELSKSVIEHVRKTAETCKCLQGLQMMHSIGGGSGAGLGTLLLLLNYVDYHHYLIPFLSNAKKIFGWKLIGLNEGSKRLTLTMRRDSAVINVSTFLKDEVRIFIRDIGTVAVVRCLLRFGYW